MLIRSPRRSSTIFELGRQVARKFLPQSVRRKLGSRLVNFANRGQFERLFSPISGCLRSTSRLSEQEKIRGRAYFQHREKAEATLAAATSWYGGDYMEFGACDFFTFRNMLSAYDMAGVDDRYPDTRFYAFDVFGKLTSDNPDVQSAMSAFDERTSYFSMQFPAGDDYQRHVELLKEHGLFVDRCYLVQGFFQDTLSADFAASYRPREIGYAFIDCNFEEHYRTVFEFIFDLMAPNSYIYMDEYFQSAGTAHYFAEFVERLRSQRNIECMFLRAAGGVGGLFRLRPALDLPALNLP